MSRTPRPKSPAEEDFGMEIDAAPDVLVELARAQYEITNENVTRLYKAARCLFRALLRRSGQSERVVSALLTKFNDAGPRSAPWKPVSSRVPGRPQDGKDGNRISRWELPADHKFFATRIDGTLVAIKYILQTLSMSGAPECPPGVSSAFRWLLGHDVIPGHFKDPIQRIDIDFDKVCENPRLITSGHMVPLDRGGRHIPSNTSLLLKVSNDLQGNNTVDELLDLIHQILHRHGRV